MMTEVEDGQLTFVSLDHAMPNNDDANESPSLGFLTPSEEVDPVDKLAAGVLSVHSPQLKQMTESLGELICNQQVLIETVQQENVKYSGVLPCNLNVMFEQVKFYQGKLTNIRREMTQLHEKSQRLKARAQKLQQQREKESQIRTLQKREERDREQQLIAKPVSRK